MMPNGCGGKAGHRQRDGLRSVKLWLVAVIASTALACSRSGLEVGVTSTSSNGGAPDGGAATRGGAPMASGGFVSGTGGSSSPPLSPRGRWIAVETKDQANFRQQFGVRLGQTRVDAVVRLDPLGQYTGSYGEFGPNGRGYGVLFEEGGSWNARLVDFAFATPTFVELPRAESGERVWVGPWLDERRVLVNYGVEGGESPPSSCLLVDLDRPSELLPWDAVSRSTGCRWHLGVSPGGRWLYSTRRVGSSAGTIEFVEILPEGLAEVRAELPASPGLLPAYFSFDTNESVVVAMLAGETARQVSALDLRSGSLHSHDSPPDASPNFVTMGPAGIRYLVHATRVVNQRASLPVTVVDFSRQERAEVTPANFFASVHGFTLDDAGVLLQSWADEFGRYPVSWVDLRSLPGVPSPLPLLGSKGDPIQRGWLETRGARFLALTEGPATRLEQFDFAIGPNAAVPLAQLSQLVPVDVASLSPREDALVYRTVTSSDVVMTTDPLDRHRLVQDLGTYVVDTHGGEPTKLGFAWTDYDGIEWLPDSSGLLRLGPEGVVPIVSDLEWAIDVDVRLVPNGAQYSLSWLRFDGGAGELVELSALFGSELRPSGTFLAVPAQFP